MTCAAYMSTHSVEGHPPKHETFQDVKMAYPADSQVLFTAQNVRVFQQVTLNITQRT